MSPVPLPTEVLGTGTSPLVPPWAVSIKLIDQSVTQPFESPSKANNVSCCVVTKTTLCFTPLKGTFASQRGWP